MQDYEYEQQRYEATMMAGAAQYQDVIDALNEAGLPTSFIETGGMNAALEVQLEAGETLLITDAEDAPPWDRADQEGRSVGRYVREGEYDDGPIAFATAPNTQLAALERLLHSVLLKRFIPPR